MSEKLLDVKNLKTVFHTYEDEITAVENISFHINKGETIGIVGESGCGKSVTSLSIMRLLPSNGKIACGEIVFDNKNLVTLPDKEMRNIRGNEISMIFQEPMTSLNPVYTVGDQIAETIRLHQNIDKKKSLLHAVEALKVVGIPSPEKRVKEYPHQLSGGMRQRVMIAMALACNPKLIIADEPTTALDVTIQAQILDLMKDLKQKFNTSILLITHDLGVVADMASRIIVMYAGQIVEESSVEELFRNPLHPYTEGLLKSIPRIGKSKNEKLNVIKGMVPNPRNMPTGCRFNPRCEYSKDICIKQKPLLQEIDIGRFVRCWRWEGVEK